MLSKDEVYEGMVVELVSGSPPMVVTEVNEEDVSVAWYNVVSGEVTSENYLSLCAIRPIATPKKKPKKKQLRLPGVKP